MASRERPPADLDSPTRKAPPVSLRGALLHVPTLTLLAHAEAARIGERAVLHALTAGEPARVSRSTTRFDHPGGRSPRPLADPFLSREPAFVVESDAGEIVLREGHAGAEVQVDGEPLTGARVVTRALERGVVIQVADRCVLLLHLTLASEGRRIVIPDLVGESDAAVKLRRDVDRVAGTEMRVLIRGETGTGKELVARAIHQRSTRRERPYVAVNMGAVQPSLAASALFGHVRGAFSGAVADHDGHFAAADGGTLFLDEVGDTEATVQAMMLRTLETGELSRVGDKRVRKVDVRLLSATDADLEAAVAAGRFREPLLHRIGEVSVHVPPLSARRDDLGRLLVHFLRGLLSTDDQARFLPVEPADRPWLSAAVVARIALAPLAGNVRQLRNVARTLVVHGRDASALRADAELDAVLRGTSGAPAPAPSAPPPTSSPRRSQRKRPRELSEGELLAALEQTGWRRDEAAKVLGIARSTLYAAIAAHDGISRAGALDRAEIEASLSRCGGDAAAAATELRVSEHGLKLRMRSLGLR